MLMPVAEWAPDQADLSEATSIATNVLPLTEQSYGPIYSLVNYSTNVLEGSCIGMGFAEDTTSTNHLFAGTAATLQILTAGGTSWADVTVAGGYTATAAENWNFAQYNNLMLATDFADPIQAYNMISSSAFAELSSAAPNARYIAVAKTFAIVANTYDSVGGTNPARLWWSSAGDPTTWPTPGSTTAQQDQSDYNDMIGPQGQITGLAPNLAGCDCAVFFERGVFNMFYVGPPDIFNFYPATTIRGCIAPNSIIPLGNHVAYLGEDGFYTFDGTQSTPIGASKVDKWFFAQVDQTALNLVVGAPDVANKSYVWIYRSIFAPTAQQDQLIGYRWDIGRWFNASVSTQWVARAPVPAASTSVSLVQGQLQLAVISGTATSASADILTELGGSIITETGSVALVTELTSALYLAYFAGTPLAAQVGTKVMQINPAGRTFVNRTRPLVNSSAASGSITTESGLVLLQETLMPILTENSAAVMTVAMSARVNYYDQEVFGSEISPNVMGECPQRSDGRYHRGRISIPSGVWSTMFGLDVDGIRAGLR